MTDALLRRKGLALYPADGLAEVELERFPLARDVLCTLKRIRSNPHNRLYWSCLHKACEGLGSGIEARSMHEWLKIKLGYVKPVPLRSGAVEWVTDSTAFDRMPQDQFNAYTERAFDMLKLGFGIDPEDLKREGRELLGRAQ